MARCTYTGNRGQCTHAAIDGSDFCRQHSKEGDRVRRYRITNPELVDEVGHHSDEESFKTVEQEIELLRGMIQARLNLADSKAERIAAFSVVTPMIAQVNKLVDNLARLRRVSSEVIGKAALRKLSDEIVAILIDELNDIPDRDRIIDNVADKIADAVAKAKNEQE